MGCGASAGRAMPTMHKAERAMKAALLIQRWYRRYLARLEAKKRYSWKIFQSLEYSSEQDQINLYNFFNELITLSKTDNGNSVNGLSISNVTVMNKNDVDFGNKEDESELNDMVVTSSYDGPHIVLPITVPQVEELIKTFKQKQKLHGKYVLQILHATRESLKRLPNISKISTGFSKQVTVCGDLHGKLDDLLIVFHKNGLPSAYNPYVFNGDFVDRGPHSVEVAILLFSCFLANPNTVFINRGNHEDHVMNLRYGFVKEIMVKYRHHAPKIMQYFEEVFSWLPLASIIDSEILIAHGGISTKTDLDYLERIERQRYVSVLRPPTSPECGHSVDLPEWRQMLDLLWSDPRPQNGCEANSFRGGGSYFGPDISEEILSKHHLNMLIRSHECKPDGYEYTHNGKVLTIFSASNYYEMGSNKGAYLKITRGTKLTIRVVQYMATKTARRKLTFKQRINIVEESALQNLREKICASKTILMNEFVKFDREENGVISVGEWCTAMNTVMKMELPWRSLRPQLVNASEEDGENIDYKSTFDTYTIHNKYGETASVTETLYRNKDNLETVFRALDKDKSGFISLDEFTDACSTISDHSRTFLDKCDISTMARNMDMNKDGLIDFNEFLEAFRIVDKFGNDPGNTSEGSDDGN